MFDNYNVDVMQSLQAFLNSPEVPLQVYIYIFLKCMMHAYICMACGMLASATNQVIRSCRICVVCVMEAIIARYIALTMEFK